VSSLDYFKILGIDSNATEKEIKLAYRKLAKKYHPDTYKGDKLYAENKMKEINEAYDFLSDENNRRTILQNEQAKNNYEEQTVKRDYSQSNYESGSVYDFDNRYYKGYNQSYSQYNYSPYVDENDSNYMYYIDFEKIKRKIFGGLKRTLLISTCLVVIFIAFIIVAIQNVFSGINNFFDSLTVKNDYKPETSSQIVTTPEVTEEDYMIYKENVEKAFSEFNEVLKSFEGNADTTIESDESIAPNTTNEIDTSVTMTEEKAKEELNKLVSAFENWYNTYSEEISSQNY